MSYAANNSGRFDLPLKTPKTPRTFKELAADLALPVKAGTARSLIAKTIFDLRGIVTKEEPKPVAATADKPKEPDPKAEAAKKDVEAKAAADAAKKTADPKAAAAATKTP